MLASPNCAKTIGLMYGQHEKDVVEWLKGVRWCCRPTVSHAIIKDVMRSLVDAAVLKPSELLPPSALLALPPEPEATPEATNVPMEPALPAPPATAHRSLRTHAPRPAAPATAPSEPAAPATSPIAAPLAPTTPAVDLQRGANNAPIVE